MATTGELAPPAPSINSVLMHEIILGKQVIRFKNNAKRLLDVIECTSVTALHLSEGFKLLPLLLCRCHADGIRQLEMLKLSKNQNVAVVTF